MRNKFLAIGISIIMITMGFVMISGNTTAATTWYVDDSGGKDYTKIQDAIDAASSGDTIIVYDGTYLEELYIDKTITLKSASTPVIKGSKSVSTNYGNRDAVIFVEDAVNVVIEGFDIQGDGLGTTNTKNYGIIFEESSGTLKDSTVSPNTIDDMSSNAVGIWDESDVTVESCTVENYGRLGVFFYNGCTGGVYDSTLIGQSYSGAGQVSYGIEVEGAWGDDDPGTASTITVKGNDISNHDNTYYPEPTWTSSAIMINGWMGYFSAADSTVMVEENDIHDNYIGIEVSKSSVSYAYFNNIYDNRIYGVQSGPDWDDNYAVFDATNNWWGDASGPSGEGPGSGDAVSEYVEYCGWLDAEWDAVIPGTPTSGPVTNLDTGMVFCTIQTAIDSVKTLDGHTIKVKAGDYFGAVVSKAVNLVGEEGATIVDGPAHVGYSFLHDGFQIGYGADVSGLAITGFIFECVDTDDYPGLAFPIFAHNADGVTIEHNTLYKSLQGISSWKGNNWNINQNTIIDLQTLNGGGIGIFIGGAERVEVYSNTISMNMISGAVIISDGDGLGYSAAGIALYSDQRWARVGGEVYDNVIIKNHIELTGEFIPTIGIELVVRGNKDLTDVHDNSVIKNHVIGNDIGIELYQANVDNIIDHNKVKDSVEHAIYLFESNDNEIHHNLANHNGGDGINLFESNGNMIHHNKLNLNGRYGIGAESSIDNTIHHNVVMHSGTFDLYEDVHNGNTWEFNNIFKTKEFA